MEHTRKQYTISVYTENNIGLLNRISAIFQRRHINIESMNISQCQKNYWTDRKADRSHQGILPHR